MKIYKDIEQQAHEWFNLRLGVIGGSSISKAVAGGQGKVRMQLMYDLVGELISGEKKPLGFERWEIKEGIRWESQIRLAYEIKYGVDVEQIGYVKVGKYKGYSPDGFVEPEGMVEIKWASPSVYVETRATGKVPTDRRRQMQWGMSICRKKFCDYVMYCPAAREVDPLFVIRVERDEKEIKWLNKECNKFIKEMMELYKQVK